MGRRSSDEKKGQHEEEEEDKVFRRLPKCVVPIHYDLTFKPEENEQILNGKLNLRVQVLCETKQIVINGLNIAVSDVQFKHDSSNDGQQSRDVLINEDTETIEMGFQTPILPGFGVLTLNFKAQITDNMKGLYRTKMGSDSSRYNYVTHFEPTNARRCFPGFDEPAFKATFDITLIVPKDVVAISNMPIKEESQHETNNNLKVCKYETTPKMSTYLIAMVIGKFEHIEKTNQSGTLVRVFTPPGQKNNGKYSLDLAADLLDYYTQYFGLPYPLAKCDLVAIPEFPIGGMENYGLITFIDTRLLVNEDTPSINKQFTSLIVSHEVSHLWFGDLVTMKWWTDLWLKEGFAKFIEYLAVDHFFPQFDIWTQFCSRIFHGALATDSLVNSHPIEVRVTNPSEIDEIFDAISYNKGASIIKMLYHYIGDDCFRKGMKAYLEKFKFSNAETADLWEYLEAASAKPVGKFMDTFTKQMGFPIVTVTNVLTNESGGKTLTLKQEKFWADPKQYAAEHAASNDNYKWIIPLTCCKESSPTEVCVLELFDGLKSDTMKITVPGVSKNDWVKLNAASSGYYRVRYSPEVLAQFTAGIRNKTMTPLDRLGLLGDLYACVKAGLSSTSDLLQLLDAFRSEDNYCVLMCIRDITCDIRNLLLRTDILAKFDAYCIGLFKPLKAEMGWEATPEESHTDGLLRGLVINRLISCGDKDTMNEAEKMFQKHTDEDCDTKISADLRSAVYRAVLSNGNEKTLETMMEMYRKAEMSEEKARILQTLGSIKDTGLMKSVLEFGISPQVKSSDVGHIFLSLDDTKNGQDLSWEFFKNNIKMFQEKYPGGMLICAVVRSVTGNFVEEELAHDIETFFKENPIKGTERTVQQVVEKIRINSAWLKRDFETISTLLDEPRNFVLPD